MAEMLDFRRLFGFDISVIYGLIPESIRRPITGEMQAVAEDAKKEKLADRAYRLLEEMIVTLALPPGSMRRRVVSRSITWCFRAPATCRPSETNSVHTKSQCSEEKTPTTASDFGTKGRFCPKGQRIGA
mgnify:CR=1 FL=1